MRFARCLTEVGIYAGDRSLRLGRGTIVDLDTVIVPAVPATDADPGRPAETLADVLGSKRDAFDDLDTDNPEQAVATAAAREAVAAAASMTTSDQTDATDPQSEAPSPAAPPESRSGRQADSAAPAARTRR